MLFVSTLHTMLHSADGLPAVVTEQLHVCYMFVSYAKCHVDSQPCICLCVQYHMNLVLHVCGEPMGDSVFCS